MSRITRQPSARFSSDGIPSSPSEASPHAAATSGGFPRVDRSIGRPEKSEVVFHGELRDQQFLPGFITHARDAACRIADVAVVLLDFVERNALVFRDAR